MHALIGLCQISVSKAQYTRERSLLHPFDPLIPLMTSGVREAEGQLVQDYALFGVKPFKTQGFNHDIGAECAINTAYVLGSSGKEDALLNSHD